MKNKKSNMRLEIILSYLSLLMAILIGINSQDISYYIMENIINVSAQFIIVIISIISVLLFTIPPYILVKKYKTKTRWMEIYMNINFVIALPILTFTIIVLLFWLS